MLNDQIDLHSLFKKIDFSGRSHIIVAVSGGGDSLALLFLLHEFLSSYGPSAPKLLAVTIDHSLRSESASEANYVSQLCRQYSIKHRTLVWSEPKPLTGLSQAAREARQDLLVKAAMEANTDMVFIAHNANDQAETVSMRLARGKGVGTAGIAQSSLYKGHIWFVRPCLRISREALRAYLSDRTIKWIDDPSNSNPAYERVRVRQSLNSQDHISLLKLSKAAAFERKQQGIYVADLVRESVRLISPGLFSFPQIVLQEAEPEAALYFLRMLLAVVGGVSHLPDHERVALLLPKLLESGGRATLSRAMVSWRMGHVYLHRESRSLSREKVQNAMIWDGRWQIQLSDPSDDYQISALGFQNAKAAFQNIPEVPSNLAIRALSAEPALYKNDETPISMAELPAGISAQRILSPWHRLIPDFDLEPNLALSALFNGMRLNPRPWQCHKQD